MSTHDLFKKHFGNTAAVDMKHPNMESFFEELNAECLEEDKHKNCNIPCVVRRSEQLKALLSKVVNEFDSGEVTWDTRDEIESILKSL